ISCPSPSLLTGIRLHLFVPGAWLEVWRSLSCHQSSQTTKERGHNAMCPLPTDRLLTMCPWFYWSVSYRHNAMCP
ncbi:hypothetical protein DFH07DRAFT_851354, partial [Mycena maculata]